MTNQSGGKALFAEERKRRLVEYINTRRRVLVSELVDRFGVSGATIRSDLRDLDETGLITRTHGGAIRRSRTRYEPDMDFRAIRHVEEKRKIARMALELINDGDSLILDTGTTVTELARMLGSKKGLTVVTNDIVVAAILEKETTFDIMVIGGLIRRGFHCTVDDGLLSNIQSLSVDKAILGTNAFSAAKGASAPNPGQSEIKRRMLSIAGQRILLCDSTKLERDSFVNFASPSQIDILVTEIVAPDQRQAYEEQGIIVVSAM